MKYSKTLEKRICDLISTGEFTISDICKQVGISKDTLYRWLKTKSDFSDSYKKAHDKRIEAFKFMARSGLAKLLDVFEYDEITTEYAIPKGSKTNRPIIIYQRIIRKKVMPNPLAVIFALTNMDPENFKHRTDIISKGDSIKQTIIELPPIIGMKIYDSSTNTENVISEGSNPIDDTKK